MPAGPKKKSADSSANQTGTFGSTNAEFAMFLSQGWRQNRTKLLGENFSFSPGAEDGDTEVAPIRFGQELTTRSQVDALAVRSTFSFGTKYLGATEHSDPDLPDGRSSVYWVWKLLPAFCTRLF